MMLGRVHPATTYPILGFYPAQAAEIDGYRGWVGVWDGLLPYSGVILTKFIEPARSGAKPCIPPVSEDCTPVGGPEVQMDLQMPVSAHTGQVQDRFISTTRLTQRELVSIVKRLYCKVTLLAVREGTGAAVGEQEAGRRDRRGRSGQRRPGVWSPPESASICKPRAFMARQWRLHGWESTETISVWRAKGP